MSDTTRSIIHSASRFFSGTMLSRITGLLRDMAMAYAFGTQSAVAALLVAFRFAHLLRRLLGEGAMQTALIPHFEALRKESPESAKAFFRDLSASLTHLLVILIGTIMLILGIVLASDLLSDSNAEIAWLTLLMMPSLLFICLFGINTALLQCHHSYFLPSVAPIFFNLIWIVGVLCLRSLPITQAMTGLSFFIIIACAAQWAVTIPQTRALLTVCDPQPKKRAAVRYSQEVRKLLSPLALGIIGIAAAQINNALDAVFARWANEEGPAILWYAIRIQQLPLALFGIAISGALLPPLTRAIKNNDPHQFHYFIDFAIRKTLLLMLPITAIIFVMGDTCISWIYGRGDFTTHSILETTKALWGYGLGLIPMALVLICAPAFYAKQDYRTPSIASAASMGINVGLNTLFIAWFGWGATSIAIATSISAWFNLAWLWVILKRQYGSYSFVSLWKETGKIIAATSVAASGVAICSFSLWGESTAWKILIGQYPAYSFSFFDQTLRLAVEGGVFIALFALIAWPLFFQQEIANQSDTLRE